VSRRVPQFVMLVVCLWGAVDAQERPGAWLDVPFVRQERDGCGAASIAMVMQYWQRHEGKAADPGSDAKQIQQALYSGAAHGIYASDLERYLEQHGFRTFAFRGQWSDFRPHLEKGRPLIAALKPDARAAALHYVVIVGLDWKHGLVLLNDPAERKLLQQERPDFERQWKGAGNWTLLAIPREGVSSGHSPSF
jgi:ABC-type bacteriocin/lantibiotic exporter with double-glycine peptidase domain